MSTGDGAGLRILPTAEGVGACLRAGFPASHLLCMQGPFSQALNEALAQV